MDQQPGLQKFQYGIVSLLFDRLNLRDPVTPLNFVLAGNGTGAFDAVVGAFEAADDEGLLVASLPRNSNTVFLALTRKGELDVARVLANIEDMERETGKSLEVGEVIRHPARSEDSTLHPFATILLPAATATVLHPLSSSPIIINDREVRFMFVLPLDSREFECRKNSGHDALIDMFQREGKSLFFDA
jgi:hypothetical protein